MATDFGFNCGSLARSSCPHLISPMRNKKYSTERHNKSRVTFECGSNSGSLQKKQQLQKTCNQLQCEERRNQRCDKKNLNKNRRNFGESTTAASTSGLGRGLYVILKGLAVYLKRDSFPSLRNLLIFVTKWPFNKRQRILMNEWPRKNPSLNPRDEEDYTSY